jgi:fibro-slime domain-containing protein
MKSLKRLISLIVLLAATQTFTQIYQDSMWMQVIFYDFKADGTNPDFENCISGLKRGMVQPTLDSMRKPVFRQNLACNTHVNEWFRPSGANGSDGNANFSYNPTTRKWQWSNLKRYNNRPSEFVSNSYSSSYDMSNIVIYDSLHFWHTDSGQYVFQSGSFFKLDNRGYGEQPSGSRHNYGFAMEMHTTFEYQKGLTFRFNGDDDVWVFVNNRLMMDLGGVHGTQSGAFNLDTVAGLVVGETYSFDFFYAERHTSMSTIQITTNILSPKPSKIDITVFPSDTIYAGDTLTARSTVLDSAGNVRSDLSDSTRWSFVDSGGNGSSTLFPRRGSTIKFAPTVAWKLVKIKGVITYRNMQPISDTISVYVKPARPYRLTIEESPPPPSGTGLNNEIVFNTMTIPSNSISDMAYAYLRDRFGNYCSPSPRTQWNIITTTPDIVTVANGNQSIGEASVSKKGPSGQGVKIQAVFADSLNKARFKDTLTVNVSDIVYDSLTIAIRQSSTYIPIQNLLTTNDFDTTLYVRGHRKDKLYGGWEAVSGVWKVQGIPITPPTQSTSQWLFSCHDTVLNGKVIVSFNDLIDTITVNVKIGKPATIRLFQSESGIEYQDPPYFYTDSAGVAFPVYAKLFDKYNYQITTFNATQLTWRVSELSGAGTTGSLLPTTGIKTSFTPAKAGNTVRIHATFTHQSGASINDSLQIVTTAGKPDHIVIQEDTAKAGRDLLTIEMQSGDSGKVLYAIYKDKQDNFVNYVQNPVWSSKDSLVVKTTIKDVFFGAGLITRQSDNISQAWVSVSNSENTMTDSVLVNLTNITYDSLRIYVLNNGPQYIDSLQINIGDSVIAWVEGRRSDGRGWRNIPVTWSQTGTLQIPKIPQTTTDHWIIIPDSSGYGYVKVTRTGGIADSIKIRILSGKASTSVIYPEAGNPAGKQAYNSNHSVDTMIAGTTYPLYVKIFDRNGLWLSKYEDEVFANMITWRVIKTAGAASAETLSTRRGIMSSFTPTHAFNSYTIYADFKENDISFSSSIKVVIASGPAHHLVLEGSSNPTSEYLSRDNPIERLFFQYGVQTRNDVYAIIRDQFGNFISQSQKTTWSSNNDSVAMVFDEMPQLGQARVARISTAGQTVIHGVNSDNNLLQDSVTVLLSDIGYDSLRIVVNNSTPIDSLSVQLGNDTLLQVQGKRISDGTWVPVEANWLYSNSNNQVSFTNQSVLDFAPSDTGKMILIVNREPSVPDTIYITVTPGKAHSLALYRKVGNVPDLSNPPYPDPKQSIKVQAGAAVPLVAKIFDQKNNWLGIYETSGARSAQINWRVEDISLQDTSIGILKQNAGHLTSFLPLKAYQSVYIIASLQIDSLNRYSDTIMLEIGPGPVTQLVLERSPNWQLHPNASAPIDVIKFQDSIGTEKVYAILRDSLGNFAGYSTQTRWDAQDTIITIRNGNMNIGEGIIERKSKNGITKITAWDARGFYDTAQVELLAYYYKQLRIVVNQDTAIDLIIMSTNNDTLLIVQGLRSDTAIWENVAVRWQNSSSLNKVIKNPGIASSWKLSPSDTGSGWIKVTTENDNLTLPDSLFVQFTPGAPTRVVIEILTPPDQIIAGKPFTAQIRLYNRDGLIPGIYCFDAVSGKPVIYSDKISTAGRPDPFVIVDNQTLQLLQPGNQCFTQGLDTITAQFYYAPFSADSLHQLTASLGGISGSVSFKLLPAQLTRLSLETDAGKINDTLVLYAPDDATMIYAVGFDTYNNRRGPEVCDWSTSGTLHALSRSVMVSRVYYDASMVNYKESGIITAIPSDKTPVQDSAHIRIMGPLIKLISALTRDNNGNGYLDQIDLKFSRAINLSSDFSFAGLTIRSGNHIFTVDSIIGYTDRADSILHLALHEIVTPIPQTSWTPTISYDRDIDFELDSVINRKTTDGAGPVIWRVIKEITNLNNRKTDIITIAFSEPIHRVHDGARISTADHPEDILYVWDKNEDGTYDLIDKILHGINNFQTVGDTIISFVTANGFDISARHYFSFNGDTPYVADNSNHNNTPLTINRKVTVMVIGPEPVEICVAPNPARANFNHVAAGTFTATHNPLARRWVTNDRSGVLLTFPILLPSLQEQGIKIRCIARIYDIAGNPVISGDTPDLLSSIPSSARNANGSAYNIDIYWNGSNRDGMRVAPGIYQAYIVLKYSGPQELLSKYHDTKITGTIGVAK